MVDKVSVLTHTYTYPHKTIWKTQVAISDYQSDRPFYSQSYICQSLL